MNEIINIKTINDGDSGSLSFFEANLTIPFEIKRIYYTYNTPIGVKRGMHAHKKLKQLLWCPFGEIEITIDDGFKKTVYLLDTPDKGLLITIGFWREFYSKKENSVLIVAASDYYDENDYIRSYNEFIEYVRKGYWENENRV